MKKDKKKPEGQEEPEGKSLKDMTPEEFEKMIEEQTEKAIQPYLSPESKIEHGDDPDEGSPEDSEGLEKAAEYVRALVRGDIEVVKALSSGTDSSGGYLVPDEFRAEVIRTAEKHGIARAQCRVVPMGSGQASYPKGTSGVSVSWPGEGSEGSTSDPAFGLANLLAKTAVGLTAVPNELLDDADVDVIAYLATLFGEALAKEEDTQLFAGDGSPFVGLMEAAGVNVVNMASGETSFADVTADHLLDLIDAVSEEAEDSAGFYFNKNILTYLRKLKDDNGQYVWDRPAGEKPGTVFGYPYKTTSVMPGNVADAVSTKFVAFGNLKNVLFGDRQQMTITLASIAGLAIGCGWALATRSFASPFGFAPAIAAGALIALLAPQSFRPF